MASTPSSSSSAKTIYDHDVFINFRGDTRNNFTSHLYQKLVDKQISTFSDVEDLERGEEIDPSLMEAIEASKISVVVFSEAYASSSYCLNELVKIIECSERGQIVYPIFYNVKWEDVQEQTGIFGKGFRVLVADHDKKTKDMWKKALVDACKFAGWDLKNFSFNEAKLIEKVVEDIVKKLLPASFSKPEYLSGIEPQIEQVLSLLSSLPNKIAHFFGIWGMGGIGKTTLAENILGRISDRFDSCCSLHNVREKCKKLGIEYLRNDLFSKLLDQNLNLQLFNLLPNFVIDRLKRKKVLVLLDDVNEAAQLSDLIGDEGWLGPGSIVIVTSRDETVLRRCEETYKVKELQDTDAFRLLIKHAFKQYNYSKDYDELAMRAVAYAKGVPLALKVLGSHLCDSSPADWKIELNKIIKHCPHPEIQRILKVSYDELEQEAKDIFLDIACFFRGCKKDYVRDLLGTKDFDCQIKQLQKKCLLTTGDGNVLDMHDLIQEMGIYIGEQEGSRLSDSQRIRQMLMSDKRNEAIQGMRMDISEIRQVKLHKEAFSRMKNLRILKFYRPRNKMVKNEPVFVPESDQSEHLLSLPSSLSLLHWEEYPYSYLPSIFPMENLVELDLFGSNIRGLWDEDMCLENLKTLRLSGCQRLERLPELSSAINLEEIHLDGCENLVEICPSLRRLQNLVLVDASKCKNLKFLPELPSAPIKELDVSGSGVVELPSSIGQLSSLIQLKMAGCKNLVTVPDSICQLKCLETLDFSGCSALRKLPHLNGLYCLEKLHLDGTALEEIPTDIYYLKSMRVLILNNCKRLRRLPKLPEQLMELQLFYCLSLETVEPTSYSPREQPFEEWREYKYMFNYCNCMKLEQNTLSKIMECAQHNIKELAIASYNNRINLRCHVNFGVPGSEIPKWYNHRSEGSSMEVLLTSSHFKTRFLGFGLAVVLEFHPAVHNIYFECKCRFRTATGEKCAIFSRYMEFDSVLESDNVFLMYTKDDWVIENGCFIDQASFEFVAFGIERLFERSKTLKVKNCGVHLIYDKDEQKEQNHSRDQTQNYFLQEAKETNTNTSNKRCGENSEEKDAALGLSNSSFKTFQELRVSNSTKAKKKSRIKNSNNNSTCSQKKIVMTHSKAVPSIGHQIEEPEVSTYSEDVPLDKEIVSETFKDAFPTQQLKQTSSEDGPSLGKAYGPRDPPEASVRAGERKVFWGCRWFRILQLLCLLLFMLFCFYSCCGLKSKTFRIQGNTHVTTETTTGADEKPTCKTIYADYKKKEVDDDQAVDDVLAKLKHKCFVPPVSAGLTPSQQWILLSQLEFILNELRRGSVLLSQIDSMQQLRDSVLAVKQYAASVGILQTRMNTIDQLLNLLDYSVDRQQLINTKLDRSREAEQRLANTGSNHASFEMKLAALREELKSTEAAIKQLSEELANAKARKDSIEKELKACQSQVYELYEEADRYYEEQVAVDAEIKALREEALLDSKLPVILSDLENWSKQL